MMKNLIIQLKQNILKEISYVDGKFALAFLILGEYGDHIYINEKEAFHAASTMKTPVMIEVFKQAQQGKFGLDDHLIIKNKFKSIVDSSPYSLSLSDDAGDELYKFIGKYKSIHELIFEMITVSSNLATNILIDLVNPKTTTALDLMIIFKCIAEGILVSEEACNEMIKILSAQKLNTKIPAKLPVNIKIAHKTGA